MREAQYVILNSRDEYFTKISKLNKALFTSNKKEAAKMNYDETQELIPLIKLYNNCNCYIGSD